MIDQHWPLILFAWILTVHWVADFVLQTHWQATNKSKKLEALIMHVSTYTLTLGIATAWVQPDFNKMVLFISVNFLLHFATDFITSRITSRLWASGQTHNFFVVVGMDQLIHALTLMTTMVLFLL